MSHVTPLRRDGSEAVPVCDVLAAPQREQERLAALDRLDILDTPQEEAFDRITRLTKKLFNFPYVIITMIDGHRAWSKSIQGIDLPEGPKHLSFCTQTILRNEPLIIPDATRDPYFADSPYVTGDFGLRFYAGIPLATSNGHNVGTLCAIDTKPRDFTPDQVEILSDLARMAVSELELRLLSTTDTLTGALSRRAFKEEANRAAALALRHRHDLSCIVMDLDYFKAVNDNHGHASGDAVLVEAVKACVGQLRATDLIGRLGGEEFAVLLPHTRRAAALEVAEKLRVAVEGLAFEFGGHRLAVTASFGVASLDHATPDADTLLKHADIALYQAKAAGRNRTGAFQSPTTDLDPQRRRVFKGGQILFNGRTSAIDCTVRSLSPKGAGIDVSETAGLPRRFDLAIKADDFEKPCRVVAQTEKHLEVEFC